MEEKFKWQLDIRDLAIWNSMKRVKGKPVDHCICPKCGKDFMDYIYGSEDWWMYTDKLPNYCPNCGDKKV